MHFLDKFTLGVWNVGIIDSDVRDIIDTNKELQIRWMKHKYKDRFFADPFLYRVDEDNYYILVEEFPFYKNIGFISLLTVERKTMRLIKKEKVIEEACHLSYPFVYHNEIVPEAYRSGKCTAYSLVDHRVEKKRIIANMGLIDQTFLEYGKREWIFATDKDNPLFGLKIFHREEKYGTWIAHKNNPVKEDIRTARPGGHFFKIGEKLYRPVQDSEKLYGNKVRIMEVTELTPDRFEEKEVAVLSSKGNPPYELGFHTFNVEDGFVVVDGYKEYFSFIIKPLCLKARRLMEFIGEKR